jgi:putative transcription antitermination factor YqgF
MSTYNQNLPKESHILGIDFGQAKVGLALADGETKIAFGYAVLKSDKNFWRQLAEITEKEEVNLIVLGRLGSVGKLEKSGVDIGEIGERIRKELGIPVEFQEEMFTSKSAQANLREKGAKQVGKIDDKEAARIILQEWLDKQ